MDDLKPGDLMEFLGAIKPGSKNSEHPKSIGDTAIIKKILPNDNCFPAHFGRRLVFDFHPFQGNQRTIFADCEASWRKVPDDRASNWKINIVGVNAGTQQEQRILERMK